MINQNVLFLYIDTYAVHSLWWIRITDSKPGWFSTCHSPKAKVSIIIPQMSSVRQSIMIFRWPSNYVWNRICRDIKQGMQLHIWEKQTLKVHCELNLYLLKLHYNYLDKCRKQYCIGALFPIFFMVAAGMSLSESKTGHCWS